VSEFALGLGGTGQIIVGLSVTLSSRERVCLGWAAQGKSSWDIGVILAISENTVNFHIKNAMKKLETTSRTVAAIKALQLGLIPAPPRLEPLHLSRAPYWPVPASSSHGRAAGSGACECGVAELPPSQSRLSGADRNQVRVGVLPLLALQSLRHKVLAWSFTREIAAGLARFGWLHVTGPTLPKDSHSPCLADDDLAHREFDYLVDGALWNQFDALQICVRLLDVVNGAHEMWSEHLQFASSDRYRLDDRTISHIAEQLDPAALSSRKSARQ
jgi:DNA-binding CsgD family transcriptional regulator/TolB-like protein